MIYIKYAIDVIGFIIYILNIKQMRESHTEIELLYLGIMLVIAAVMVGIGVWRKKKKIVFNGIIDVIIVALSGIIAWIVPCCPGQF
jgi:hypothetical protein